MFHHECAGWKLIHHIDINYQLDTNNVIYQKKNILESNPKHRKVYK